MNTATTIDCRGQRCPGPILATAKAARSLGSAGGGTLEISADDDAFPFDIRSWCRSSGSELVDLSSDGEGVHRATVRVGARPGAGTVRGVGMPPRASAPPTPPPAPRATRTAGVAPSPPASGGIEVELPTELDFRGQRCPEPILGLARRARVAAPGAELEVLADDPAFRLDLESWCRSSGATLLSLEPDGDALRARLRVAGKAPEGGSTARIPAEESIPRASVPPSGEPFVISLRGVAPAHRLSQLESSLQGVGAERVRVLADDPAFGVELVQWAAAAGHRLLGLDARDALQADLELAPPVPTTALAPVEPTAVAPTMDDQCTLLVLHNDKEALLAALLVAVGAAAQGMNVMMFFTFWGLNLLRGDGPNPNLPAEKVSWAQRMFKWMMPKGPRRQKLGKLNMGGIGGSMLGSIMKRYELMDVPELMSTAEEQGIRFVACTMSMQVMGITKRDLAVRENLEYGGVAAFVEAASRSRVSLTF